MNDKPSPRLPRLALFLVLVLLSGAAGVLAGHFLFRPGRGGEGDVRPRAPHSLLRVGQELPDVVVTDEDGVAVSVRDMVAPDGGVLLFLDLECPPCADMARKWQRELDEAVVPDLDVVGITNQPRERIAGFKSANGLHFVMAADSTMTFLRTWDVDRFPMAVVVGASGRIRQLSYDARAPVDPARLAELLAE